MNLAEAITIFISGIFTLAVADRLVTISPFGKSMVDIIFISHDGRARANRIGQNRLDGLLSNIRQHFYYQLTATFNHSQDRRFLFG